MAIFNSYVKLPEGKSSIQSWWNRQKPCFLMSQQHKPQSTAAMCPRLLTSLVQRPCHQLIPIRFCTPIFFSATQYEFLWISECIDSTKSNGVVNTQLYTHIYSSYSHENLIFPLCFNGYNWHCGQSPPGPSRAKSWQDGVWRDEFSPMNLWLKHVG